MIRTASLFLIAFWLILPVYISAQIFQPYFHRFGREAGLPSSETYCILQDREGYIWIGTDNGVARFNGHEFTVFDSDDGLDDPVVFQLREDEEGNIWASTYSGRLFYFTEECFAPHRQNDQLVKARKSLRNLALIDPSYQDGMLIYEDKRHLSVFDGDNERPHSLEFFEKNGIYLYEVPQHPDYPEVNLSLHTEVSLFCWLHSCDLHVYDEEQEQWKKVAHFTENSTELKRIVSAPGENNAYLLFYDAELLYLRNDSILTRHSGDFSNITYLHPFGEDALLVARQSGGGLLHLSNWAIAGELKIETALDQRSLSYVNIDREGGLW
ncbi:MAG: two-component regulator propeller domain-containing protein, partial [Bacteroidota bacterium]